MSAQRRIAQIAVNQNDSRVGLCSKKRDGHRGRGFTFFRHRRRKPYNLVTFHSAIYVDCQLDRAHLFRVSRERCVYHAPGGIMTSDHHSRIV